MSSAGRKLPQPCLVVITGPTGVGKTGLCTTLAADFGSPVISADSRQMYREMKKGTAPPSAADLARADHYFIGNLSIHDYYNASMFEMEATALLEQLFKTANPVFMAGGSGLYIDAVCRGIDDLPRVDPVLRKELAEKYRSRGLAWLRQQLKNLDPVYYGTVDLNNPNRMLKGVEISLMTGKPYSSFLVGEKKPRNFKIIKIGLILERKELYERINKRVSGMIDSGLVDEAKSLYPERHLNSLNTVGYKEIFDYLDGNISLEKAVELIRRNSRRYAKRQLTWLSRDKEISWFSPDEAEKIKDFILTGCRLNPEH
jgi:tRNA dimethylallyltransferase